MRVTEKETYIERGQVKKVRKETKRVWKDKEIWDGTKRE